MVLLVSWCDLRVPEGPPITRSIHIRRPRQSAPKDTRCARDLWIHRLRLLLLMHVNSKPGANPKLPWLSPTEYQSQHIARSMTARSDKAEKRSMQKGVSEYVTAKPRCHLCPKTAFFLAPARRTPPCNLARRKNIRNRRRFVTH